MVADLIFIGVAETGAVSNVNHETFMNSNYFNVFRIPEWKSKVNHSILIHYIRMMNVWKLDPKDWSGHKHI